MNRKDQFKTKQKILTDHIDMQKLIVNTTSNKEIIRKGENHLLTLEHHYIQNNINLHNTSKYD